MKMFFKNLVVGLFGVCLLFMFSACSRIGIEWDPAIFTRAPAPQLEQESLQDAMHSFTSQDYPKAQTKFEQLAQDAKNQEIQQQANLGSILSGMLSADSPEELQGLEQELTDLAQEANALNARMLKHFIKVLQEKQVHKQELQSLKSKNQAAQNRIQTLEAEKQDMAEKLQELEDLFNLMEQQKRKRFQEIK